METFFQSVQVDAFSFGIVMWELLTGEEPYANMHYGAIIGLKLTPYSSADVSWYYGR